MLISMSTSDSILESVKGDLETGYTSDKMITDEPSSVLDTKITSNTNNGSRHLLPNQLKPIRTRGIQPQRPNIDLIKRYVPPHLRTHLASRLTPHLSTLTSPPWVHSTLRPLPFGNHSVRFQLGLAAPTSFYAGLAEELLCLRLDSIPSVHAATFEDVRACGAFKWIEGNGPTIAIPAVPDMWLGNEGSIRQIRMDHDLPGNLEWPDYHASRLPAGVSPHDPSFLALTRSHVILPTISIMTPRNNLRKLHSFCTPNSLSQDAPAARAFRLSAHLAPDTDLVLLDRWEPPQRRRPREPQSWHLSYHESATRKILRGSDRTPGCHRLVRYSFGGVGVLVTFDCDAYLPQEGEFPEDKDTVADGEEKAEDEDDLSVGTDDTTQTDHTISTVATQGSTRSEEGSTRIFDPWDTNSAMATNTTTSTGLVIRHTNVIEPPQEALLTLKTRALPWSYRVKKKGPPRFVHSTFSETPSSWEDVHSHPQPNPNSTATSFREPSPIAIESLHQPSKMYEQLLYSQTPNLYLALHHAGDFSAHPLLKLDVHSHELASLRQTHIPVVDKVAGILRFIVDVTRRFGRVGIVGRPDGVIEVRKLDEEVGQLCQETMKILKDALIRNTTPL